MYFNRPEKIIARSTATENGTPDEAAFINVIPQ